MFAYAIIDAAKDKKRELNRKKLWCLFRRRNATGVEKICVALQETEGRVRVCPYAVETEAGEECPEYAFNNRPEGENEGIE